MIFANDISRRAALHFITTGTLLMATGPFTSSAEAAASPSFAVTTPIHIHSAMLRVRDLATMTDFYNRYMGLDILSQSHLETVLGKDGATLLTLLAKSTDEPDDKRSAGLFHTAFLMPTRKDLGQWLIFAVRNKIPFTGFADHFVSEALYLDDPEGNGIEVYADRSPLGWKWTDNLVTMGTEQLDLDNLVEGLPMEDSLPYVAPSGFRIGHMHLRVGDVDKAEAFYIGTAGLERTQRLSNSATFLANGHYHHHIGANIWQSRGAGKRKETMAGLESVSFSTALPLMDGLRGRLKASGADFRELGDVVEALDPWGTKVRFVPV
ncbi:VOC family protein [Rhizobium sp. KVB221]|uniref:VOC family protein n=1 Tax=Rhizobium setariae TaxID=2801340 RepID=A0A936YJP1_9HYPH|nr:VOC family protein [Rhizobium setariae]MBL0371594.1 VOC family protein [Rhizobium setariae]